MDSLFWSHKIDNVSPAHIIRVRGNDKSEELAKRCVRSCDYVAQPYVLWDAYDGTGEGQIRPPEHHNDIMKMIKVTDHYLTKGEVACALSHISLWVKCILDDRPMVILEHDAIMLRPYTSHGVYNSICYLGGVEQAEQGWAVRSVPPHASDGPNFHFMCRAHAYAIDQFVAKNMLSHVLKMGIHISLDMMLRTDLFPVHQMGLYAYDSFDGTTIPGRPEGTRNSSKNDYLK
jgi:hypothetical protein